MDQTSQNQTSFIPRKVLGRESSIREKPVGLFLVIATFIFVVALLGSGGVYLYKYSLDKSIEESSRYLNENKAALEPNTINYLLRNDKRLRAANDILNKHIVASPVFSLLEDLTLKTVRFSKFDYSNNNGKGGIIKLSGEAKSYGSVALEADTLNGNKQMIKSAVFSSLNLNERGNVTFDSVITLDPDVTNYEKAILRDSAETNLGDATSPVDEIQSAPIQ